MNPIKEVKDKQSAIEYAKYKIDKLKTILKETEISITRWETIIKLLE